MNHLDPLMRGAVIPARLSAGAGTAVWACGAGQGGMAACTAACSPPSPITSFAAAPRPGVCHAGPCRCVYADRRARSSRYCCGQCNDRAAAAAYAGDAITRPPRLRPVTSPLVRSSLAAPRGGPRPGGKG